MSIINNDIYKKALDNLYDGILISDSNGKVVYINQQYSKFTGLEEKDILGHYLQDLKERGIINQSISLTVIDTGKPYSIQHQYITGKKAFTNAVPFFEDGKLIGVVNVTRDLDALIEMRSDVIDSDLGRTELKMGSLKKLLNIDDEGLIAESASKKATLSNAIKAAPFDTTILITGESGTGKEVIARYIHNNSPRKDEAFIRVNCATIPKDLFESELFGYEEGAFTGASEKGKIGLFELANKGTILLDEIGELPLEMQTKLLRVIQEKEIQRVGGQETIPIDVRILTSTNRNLAEEVEKGNFRDDLFYRISVFPIHIDPLRDSTEDIEPLINYSLEKLNKKYKRTTTIDRDALKALERYDYPGNVRELENIIEYMYVLSEDELKLESIPGKVLTNIMINSQTITGENISTLDDLMNLYEKTVIEDTVKNYDTLSEAAELLGIHVSTLSRKMKKHNLS